MIAAQRIPLKKRIALDLYAMKKSSEALSHELNYLFWECTLRCNMSCLHCGSDCVRDAAIPDMPLSHFLKVLDGIAASIEPSKVTVAITGGEPLVRSDLAEAGLKIRKRGFFWGVVTNGYLLNRAKMTEFFDAGIGSMAISLDGLEPEHNWFRGNKESFKRAVSAIGFAADYSSQDLNFDVVTCVHQKNFKDLEKLKTVLVEKGVKKWRLVSIFPKGRAKDNAELKLTGEELRQLLEFIKKTRDEGAILATYGCEGFLGGYEMEVRDIPFYCRAGIGIGSVLVDGSISACPSLRADYIQGSIYKDDFMDVWNNRFQVMRNRKWLKTGNCLKCKVWKYCYGNGLHLRDEKSGDLLYCNYEALTTG